MQTTNNSQYVTFEQAKWLKEKGFNEGCENEYFMESGELRYAEPRDKYVLRYVYKFYNDALGICVAPEHYQVVKWLWTKYGIWVSVDMLFEPQQIGFWYCIRQSKEDDKAIQSKEYKTANEAYIAAFDYIKNNNLI